MKSQKQTKSNPINSIPKKAVKDFSKKDLFTSMDLFFDKNLLLFFWIGLILSVLFSLLLFDFKVSDGGDDSAYIVRAYDVIHGGIFPSFQGPLYPLLLSAVMLITGVKVTLFKVISLIFMCAQYVLLYKAFAKRIPSSLLVSMLLVISVCSSLLYFSSQTYSEAFFMFLQAVLFFYVFKYIIDRWDEKITLKTDWTHYLVIGLLMAATYYTRNVGLVSVLALMTFLMLFKKWKQAFFVVGSFFSAIIPLEILKRLIWSSETLQFSDQGKTLLLKDAYTPAKGTEDFVGFLHRFIDNAHIYLSKHFFVFSGLKTAEQPTTTPFLTYIIFALVIIALIFTFKKNKYLLFTVIYGAGLASVTFFAVQAHWDQPRLSIVFYPILILTLFAGIYYLLSLKKLKSFQFLLPIVIIILFFASFKMTISKTSEHAKTLQANLSGNMYYGMTPDWVNYIEMSKYAAKNLPKNELTACRKPDISFVYSGAKFFGIYNIPTVNIDTFNLALKATPDIKIVGLNLLKVNENQNVSRAHTMIMKYTYAFINANLLDENRTAKESKVIGVYKVPSLIADSLMAQMKGDGVEFVEDVPSVVQKIHKDNWSYAIQDPEAMLNTLKENKVRYAILASLRKIPQYNTGEIISTIHRYIYFIQLKYPSIVQEVHKIGDSEPAMLLKFNY